MQFNVALMLTFALVSANKESPARDLVNNSNLKAFRMHSNPHTPDVSSGYQTRKALNKPSDTNMHVVNLSPRPSFCQLPVSSSALLCSVIVCLLSRCLPVTKQMAFITHRWLVSSLQRVTFVIKAKELDTH